MTYLQELCIILMEVLCYQCFLQIFIGRKQEKRLPYYLGVSAHFLLVYFCVYIFEWNVVLKLCMIFCLYTLFTFLFHNGNWHKKIFFEIIFFICMNGIDYLLILILPNLLRIDMHQLEDYSLQTTILVLVSRIVLFIGILCVGQKYKKEEMGQVAEGVWLRFLYFPAMTLVILVVIAAQSIKSGEENILYLFIIFLLIVMNFYVFYLIRDVIKVEKERANQKLLYTKMQSDFKYYQTISENYDRQKKEVHEFDNKILCIHELLQKEKYKEACQYVSDVTEHLQEKIDFIDTNHIMVNAVLNAKYREIQKKGILFVLKIGDVSKLTLSDNEIVTILANLLDNAIEACEKCKSNQYIRLKMNIENDINFVLSVQNSMVGKLKMEDGVIKTTKEEKHLHGIGLSNVIELIEKNGGDFTIVTKDDSFGFSMIVPLKKSL